MNNKRFFALVLVLILAFSALLTGCMYAAAKDRGDPQSYSVTPATEVSAEAMPEEPPQETSGDRAEETSEGSVILPEPDGLKEDKPTPQATLEEKFKAMSAYDEETGIITVITKEYLDSYWAGSEIRALTTDEVLYIIQDSIQLYFNYRGYTLTGHSALASHEDLASFCPDFAKDLTVIPKLTNAEYAKDNQEALNQIKRLILYRIAALSHRDTVFTADTALVYCGNAPAAFNSLFPETVFYIPDYKGAKDREKALLQIGSMTDFTDTENWVDLFEIIGHGELYSPITHVTAQRSNQVFPTPEIEEQEIGAAEESFLLVFTCNSYDGTLCHLLPLKTKDLLLDLIENAEWANSAHKCAPKYVFNINGEEYVYNSYCGCFTHNGKEGARTFTLDDEMQDKLNEYLARSAVMVKPDLEGETNIGEEIVVDPLYSLRHRLLKLQTAYDGCKGYALITGTDIAYPIFGDEEAQPPRSALTTDHNLTQGYFDNRNLVLWGEEGGTVYKLLKELIDGQEDSKIDKNTEITVVTAHALYVYRYYAAYPTEDEGFKASFADATECAEHLEGVAEMDVLGGSELVGYPPIITLAAKDGNGYCVLQGTWTETVGLYTNADGEVEIG